jgi:hypothetical protein
MQYIGTANMKIMSVARAIYSSFFEKFKKYNFGVSKKSEIKSAC